MIITLNYAMQAFHVMIMMFNSAMQALNVIIMMFNRVFQDSRFSLIKKAEPTKHKPGGYIERIQKDF